MVISLLFSLSCFAQQHDNIWLLGRETSSSTILDFTGGVLQVDSMSRNMPFGRSNASTCDSIGNLIFYTNGIGVNSSQNQLMQNGDSLNPGQVANDFRNVGYFLFNSVLSLPHPEQTNKYYLFHQSATYASDMAGFGEHLYYSLIDMNVNNGLGRVEQKNQTLASDSLGNGQLQAIKHANGKDWWLVQPMAWTNGFYIFLVSDTITLVHKQYIGNANRDGNKVWMGQASFAPDGSKYARYDFYNDLDIYDFDRCTGLFSNPIHIPIQDTIDVFGGTNTGVAISPNSRYLYVSSYHQIYQFDLWATNIPASKDTVAIHDGFIDLSPTTFSFMLLAPDDKIYCLSNWSHYLHVIDSPNLADTACNVLQHSVQTYHLTQTHFPNFPHYRTAPLASSACDTTPLSTTDIRITKESNIAIYPNPTNSVLNIEAEQSIDKVIVYDALGRQVVYREPKQQITEVDTKSLENGTYFISLFVDDKVINKSFQVLR